MAQSGGIGEIIPIILIGGAAWVAWSLYQSYQAGQFSTVAAPPSGGSTGTTSTTTVAPPATPAVIIPAGFTVTPDVNNSYKGTVTFNGAPTSFNVILANAGNATGVVWNSAGQDVTATLGAANVTTLVNAFQSYVNNAKIAGTKGFSGLGAVLPVPMMLRPVRRRFA